MAEQQKVTLGQVVIAIIFIIFISRGYINAINSDSTTNSTPIRQAQSTQTQRNQNLMKITNDFVLEGKANGLIKKVDTMCEEDKCIFTFWLNENLYNQYGYEDKQGIKRLIMEYGELRGEGGIMRGYYSGKYL